jgi:hypothetical protein
MTIDLEKFDWKALEGLPPDELGKLLGDDFDEVFRYVSWLRAAERARDSHLEFVKFTMPHPEHYQDANYSKFDVQAHHRLLAEALENVFTGKCLRLIISMPPQHGKSEMLTRRGLAWHVGRFPWKHLLMGTYNQTFAEEFGDDVRSIINSPEFRQVFPHVRLRTGSKAKDHMVTEDGGKISFLGRGGSGTGRPADGLLIDDPFKDAKEAESKTIRDDAWNWFSRVANTRCHGLSWQIIICTRWSDDDIVARLTDPKNPHYRESVAKQWTVINLPAILDDARLAEALGKQVGEPLWGSRFPLQLLNTAREMDPIGFSALYMGRPTPPEGSFYKEWMLATYDSPTMFPKRVRSYLTGDLAPSPAMNADKSCVGVWGLDENDTLWLHPELYWDRRSSDESVEKIIELGSRFEVSDSWWEKGQLEKAIGPFLVKRHMELVREQRAKGVDGNDYRPRYFNITALPVAGSKGLKSTAIRGRMSQRKVMFPSFAPWWAAAKEQMLKFTGSGNDKEDDFCDMLALIGQALDDQVPATSGDMGNVVKYPKVGTLAWTKWAHNREQAHRKRFAALRGM